MLSHAGTQKIETERLLLRPFRFTDDTDMLRHWIADEKVQSMYGEPVYTTKADVRALLEKYIGSYQGNDSYRWAVILKENDACIGQIAYFLLDSNNHFAEIEYCIGRAFQRRGLATEATKAVVAYGFEKINLHKIQICHRTTNLPSRRVIEKCGFVYEGTLRDFFYMGGGYEDRLYYSILRNEFDAKTGSDTEKAPHA